MKKFIHKFDEEKEKYKINKFLISSRKTVVVQGMGFVGSAMIAALTQAKKKNGDLLYNVIGVDLADEKNYWKIKKANSGNPPIISSDKKMIKAFLNAKKIKIF